MCSLLYTFISFERKKDSQVGSQGGSLSARSFDLARPGLAPPLRGIRKWLSEKSTKVDVPVSRRQGHVHHHTGQQRNDAARGAHQSVEMGSAKQPQAKLQQVDRSHFLIPQAKVTTYCGRCSAFQPCRNFLQAAIS